MRPVLFQIGGTIIWSHAVFAFLGVAAAAGISWKIAGQKGRADSNMLLIFSGGLLLAAIFARYGLLFRYSLEPGSPTLRGFLAYGGQTLLGGLAGGYFGVLLAKRALRYDRPTGDIFAPGVALGIAIGRIGCYLAERPGTPTTLPWAVTVPADAAARIPDCPACAAGVPMHPSFLYEALFLALSAYLLLQLQRGRIASPKWMREGDSFKLFLLCYGLFRFAVEFVRGNPVMALGFSGSQLMVLAVMPFLAFHFFRRTRSNFQTTPMASIAD